MSLDLTREKLEEYAASLERGELKLDEVIAGLIAVHGATRLDVEGPEAFLDYVRTLGVPLDQIEMSDELREEFEAMERR